jgi:hypothetical protein
MHWFPCGIFYFHKTKAKQPKTTMNRDANLSLSFSPHEEKKLGNDNEPPDLSLPFALKEKNAKNDNELGGLLSSSAIKVKQLKTMTSRDPGSLSSFALEEKTKRQ